MIASLSRLFRRLRVDAPAWIEVVELQRPFAAGAPCSLSMCVKPEEFTARPGHLPGAVNVPLADLPSRTGELAARRQPIVVVCKTDADPPGQQRSYLQRASGTSLFFVVEQTIGIDKGWLSNSVGMTGPVQRWLAH
jgi:hypothetical protein